MIRVGIIGLGYWGPNLARCFGNTADTQLVAICDRDAESLERVSKQFPHVRTYSSHEEVIHGDLVDAVVIATPTATHFPIARQALSAGLHTFVEKPLATSSAECQELIDLAEQQQRMLFVGHVFLYSAPVAKLRHLVLNGDLGELCYISSKRLNLGPVRQDVNALWDLAPHDISIILELMGELPLSVSCSGLDYLKAKVHDVCSLTLHFDDNRMGIVHVSWLDPHKRREMTVVGSRKMAVYDDLSPLEKIKVYDIGVEAPAYAGSFGEFQYSYRYGDTYSPRIQEVEPLKAECQGFIDCIRNRTSPRTDGQNGMDVVKILEAAERSLHGDGGRVQVEPSDIAKALV
jgi:predicted dehydrogenase